MAPDSTVQPTVAMVCAQWQQQQKCEGKACTATITIPQVLFFKIKHKQTTQSLVIF